MLNSCVPEEEVDGTCGPWGRGFGCGAGSLITSTANQQSIETIKFTESQNMTQTRFKIAAERMLTDTHTLGQELYVLTNRLQETNWLFTAANARSSCCECGVASRREKAKSFCGEIWCGFLQNFCRIIISRQKRNALIYSR